MASSLEIACKVTFLGIIYIGCESLIINTQPLITKYIGQLLSNKRNDQLKITVAVSGCCTTATVYASH